METAGRNSRHSPASDSTPNTAPMKPASRKKSNQPMRRNRSRKAVACPHASLGCIVVRRPSRVNVPLRRGELFTTEAQSTQRKDTEHKVRSSLHALSLCALCLLRRGELFTTETQRSQRKDTEHKVRTSLRALSLCALCLCGEGFSVP